MPFWIKSSTSWITNQQDVHTIALTQQRDLLDKLTNALSFAEKVSMVAVTLLLTFKDKQSKKLKSARTMQGTLKT